MTKPNEKSKDETASVTIKLSPSDPDWRFIHDTGLLPAVAALVSHLKKHNSAEFECLVLSIRCIRKSSLPLGSVEVVGGTPEFLASLNREYTNE